MWTMPPAIMQGAGAPPASGVTWNPLDKSSSCLLSNGNLTAGDAETAVPAQVRATVAKSSGKFYWEIAVGNWASNFPYIGIRAQSADITASYGPFGAGGDFGIYVRSPNDGHQRYKPGANSGGAITPAVAVADVFMCALDLDGLVYWSGRNGTWDAGGNPATNTGGIAIGAGTWCPWVNVDAGAEVTARFASGDWAYSAPSGFSELTP